MASPPATLDYDLLDDVLPALTGPADPIRGELLGCQVAAIGPVVEYALLAAQRPTVLPGLAGVTASPVAASLATTLATPWGGQPKTTDLSSRVCEFSRLPERSHAADPFWVAFVQRVRRAASEAGFDPTTARKLVGSFAELADNIWEHSDAPDTGVVGYRSVVGRLEFVIADAGIGAVASLNMKPEYTHLSDAGTALEVAVTLADTPYGRRTGRGSGYRTMLANLLDLTGTVRVRSGDHGVAMSGSQLSVGSATTFQTAHLAGFFLAVECRTREI